MGYIAQSEIEFEEVPEGVEWQERSYPSKYRDALIELRDQCKASRSNAKCLKLAAFAEASIRRHAKKQKIPIRIGKHADGESIWVQYAGIYSPEQLILELLSEGPMSLSDLSSELENDWPSIKLDQVLGRMGDVVAENTATGRKWKLKGD